MKFFNFLRASQTKSPKQEHRFDFHEDDFCRVEMRPKENWSELQQNLMLIGKINQGHSSEFGFSKVHVIQEGKVKIIDREIIVLELEEIISKTGFKKFDIITSGYGSQVYVSDHSTGYGEKGCALLFERNQEYVDHIWFDYYPTADNRNTIDRIYNYIYEISTKWNLVLVDWNQEVLVDSQNQEILMKYLNGEFKNDQ